MILDIPTLETERLILRAPVWADFDDYAAFRASPRAASVGGPFPRAAAFDHLCGIAGHWQLRGYGRWIVADKSTDAPLGLVGLYYPEGWPEPEIGWSVFDAAEGKGIAFEAALATRSYAYETLGWSTVISLIGTANRRSIALAKRMDARLDGTFRHDIYGDMLIYRHPTPQELT